MERPEKIVYYDGLCPLCNRLVKFILKRDKEGLFSFAPLQSPYAERTVPQELRENTDSVILREGDSFTLRSEAAFRILKVSGGPWKILLVFSVLPVKVNDFFYNIIARTRYNTFGRLQDCPLPPENEKHRFLA
ncbi:MAG: DUF393 domain-containing protein [Bacteroidales bacterium]|nr:DUF393 domain-containing protein [Bacteroidales bacterium]